MDQSIETMNKFAVSAYGGGIVVLGSGPVLRGPVSKADALNLAAWLVAMSGAQREEFEAVLDAVEST
jgi:hypothetical protein